MTLRPVYADLHIHTCLSPCGEWEMSPRAVVEKSREIGLDIIAVCDHNSAENAAAVMRLGKKTGLCVLPGLEICSKEEVHILALFADIGSALAMQEKVQSHLPGVNRPDYFGYQIIADENDEVIGESDKMLIGATTLSLQKIVEKTHLLGGLSIAAHIDRPAFGILSQLGFIPPDLPLDAVEISYRVCLKEAGKKFPLFPRLPLITSSDAHQPDDIGRARTKMMTASPGLEEIRLALQGREGRYIVLDDES